MRRSTSLVLAQVCYKELPKYNSESARGLAPVRASVRTVEKFMAEVQIMFGGACSVKCNVTET